MITRAQRRRPRQRGAAMVEGIVVMTTMLVFLGLILFAGKAYGAKVDQSAKVRSDVLYYASHACEVMPDDADEVNPTSTAIGAADDAAVTSDSDTSLATSRAATIDQDYDYALERTWNMASSSAERSVDGEAIVDLRRMPVTTRVKTTSYVACNERSYDGMWMGLADFGVSWVKSGGGIF